jgi:NAD(P)-dependent dehydrogenase (short-subunit alcohol dehydrogenase family)
MVSSGAAAHPAPGWSGYAAAKAGLDHFVRTLAAELDEAGVGVRVHALYPGVVDTSMQQRIRELPEDQFGRVERYRGYYRRGQLRPPEQPAALIWWLATPMAAGWHGRVSNLDDPAIRERIAADLDVPVFAGRDG